MIYIMILRNFVIHEGKTGSAVTCFPGLRSLSRKQCPSHPGGEKPDPEFLLLQMLY